MRAYSRISQADAPVRPPPPGHTSDEVTLLRGLAQSNAGSPLDELRIALLNDPDLDLGMLLREDGRAYG